MNEAVMRAVGGRLKEFRLSLGLTQDQFASKLGVKRQTISKWERGESLPDFEQSVMLYMLGLSLDYAASGVRSVPVSRYAYERAMPGPACRGCVSLTVRDPAPAL